MNQPNTIREVIGKIAHMEQAPTETVSRMPVNATQGLAWAVGMMARIQGKTVDRLRLHEAVSNRQQELVALSELPVDDLQAGDPKFTELWQSIVVANPSRSTLRNSG